MKKTLYIDLDNGLVDFPSRKTGSGSVYHNQIEQLETALEEFRSVEAALMNNGEVEV